MPGRMPGYINKYHSLMTKVTVHFMLILLLGYLLFIDLLDSQWQCYILQFIRATNQMFLS